MKDMFQSLSPQIKRPNFSVKLLEVKVSFKGNVLMKIKKLPICKRSEWESSRWQRLTTLVKYSECTLSFSRINHWITKNTFVVLIHKEKRCSSTKHLKESFTLEQVLLLQMKSISQNLSPQIKRSDWKTNFKR